MPVLSAETLLNRFVLKAKFRHMQVLVKLAELGSMRRASEAVNMSQPAISQQVSELERLLETDLFLRHAKGVEPTVATKDLLPVARRILGALQDASEAVANRLLSQSGCVRVSASPAAIGELLCRTLASWNSANPEILVQIVESGGNDPLAGLSGDVADIICTRQPGVVPSGWTFEACCDDLLVVVCGSGHWLADSANATPQDLGQCNWLLNRAGSVARRHFEDEYARNDWPPSSRCQLIMHVPELTKELLSTGKYLAILPRSVAQPWLAEGSVRVLNTAMNIPLPPLGFLWQPHHAGEATLKFAKHLRQLTHTMI